MFRVFFIALCISSFVWADISIDVKLVKRHKKMYWKVQGKVDLPNGSIIPLEILFGKISVPRSNVQIFVKDEKFLYYQGPIYGRILSGRYEIKVGTPRVKNKQSAPKLSKKIEFYWGTPVKERREKRLYLHFFETSLVKIQNILDTLSEKGNEFLQIPSNQRPEHVEKMKNWLRAKIFEPYEVVYKEYETMKYPKTLAPHFIGSMIDFKSILTASYEAIRLYGQKLYYEYGLSKKFPQKSDKLFARYRQDVRRLTNRILQRAPVPTNLQATDLKADLLWFNLIYGTLTKAYIKSLEKFRKGYWNKIVKEQARELKDFGVRIEDYKLSPLQKTHKTIVDNLTKITSNLKTLTSCYTGELYKKEGLEVPAHTSTKDPKKVAKELTTLFNELYLVVDKEKKKVEEDLLEYKKQVESALLIAKELQTKIEEKYTFFREQKTEDEEKRKKALEEWEIAWEVSWQQLRQSTTIALKVRKGRLKNRFYRLETLGYYLLQIHKIYLQILQQNKKDVKLEVKVRSYQRLVKLTLKDLETKLKNFP